MIHQETPELELQPSTPVLLVFGRITASDRGPVLALSNWLAVATKPDAVDRDRGRYFTGVEPGVVCLPDKAMRQASSPLALGALTYEMIKAAKGEMKPVKHEIFKQLTHIDRIDVNPVEEAKRYTGNKSLHSFKASAKVDIDISYGILVYPLGVIREGTRSLQPRLEGFLVIQTGTHDLKAMDSSDGCVRLGVQEGNETIFSRNGSYQHNPAIGESLSSDDRRAAVYQAVSEFAMQMNEDCSWMYNNKHLTKSLDKVWEAVDANRANARTEVKRAELMVWLAKKGRQVGPNMPDVDYYSHVMMRPFATLTYGDLVTLADRQGWKDEWLRSMTNP